MTSYSKEPLVKPPVEKKEPAAKEEVKEETNGTVTKGESEKKEENTAEEKMETQEEGEGDKAKKDDADPDSMEIELIVEVGVHPGRYVLPACSFSLLEFINRNPNNLEGTYIFIVSHHSEGGGGPKERGKWKKIFF